ncbi:hypothetical protein OJAV_G00115980 [Oryzias javanicus]|uniref:Glucose-6-phosphate isomerase n=1 Tax=Oryzias javanicus TaxID=123683 RepID=A0A437CSK0_ORYJA|nr:hypothetical protein OJAV_G00115980 [Oryzias javanicus]
MKRFYFTEMKGNSRSLDILDSDKRSTMALCMSLSWRFYLMETSNAASSSLRSRLTSQMSDHYGGLEGSPTLPPSERAWRGQQKAAVQQLIRRAETFTTQETITNAESAKDWFLQTAGDENHFCSVPLDQNVPVLLALLGVWYMNFFQAESLAMLPYDQYMHRFTAYFQQVMVDNQDFTHPSGRALHLSGPSAGQENHFCSVPLDQNVPVLLALLGVWYMNFFQAESLAMLPYDQYMHRFTAYFQQD